MTCNKSITANFVVTSYVLTADAGPDAGGEVIVEPSQSGGGYAAGTEVTVTAVPEEGYKFSHWSGAISGSRNPVKVVMDWDKELIANFTEATSFAWWWVIVGFVAIVVPVCVLLIRRPRTT
jgi:endoglucanase